MSDLENDRLAELRSFHLLDTGPEEAYDRLTDFCRHLFDVPIALVSLIDAQRQWFKSHPGLDAEQTPRDIAFCDHAIRTPEEVFVIEDAQHDPRFAGNPLVLEQPHIRFYAGCPLVSSQGLAMGTLCVIDREPRHFDHRQRETLRLLAEQVMQTMELRRANARFAQAARDLAESRALNDQVIRSSVVGIGIYQPDGRCVHANQALADHVGTTVDQLLQQNFRTIASWKDTHLVELALQCLATGTTQKRELTIHSSFGRPVALEVSFVALDDASGRRLLLQSVDTSAILQANRASQQAQRLFSDLFEGVMDGAVLSDLESGKVLAANPAACAMLGRDSAQILQCRREDIVDSSDPRLPVLMSIRKATGAVRGDLRLRRHPEGTFEAEISSNIRVHLDGSKVSLMLFRDISEKRRNEAQVRDRLDLIHNLAQNIPGVIYQYRLFPDGRSCFPFASEGMWQIYELRPEQVREDATQVFSRLHEDDLPMVAEAIQQSASQLTPWQQEYRVRLPTQGERWCEGFARPQRLDDGSVLWHGFITDITQRKAIEAQTQHLAYYDSLTGLPNRSLLSERIGYAISVSQRNGRIGAVLFIDLDNFKQINDAHGHTLGDHVLRTSARRIQALLRAEDTVARIGGDEFVLLLNDLGGDRDTSARAAQIVAEKVRDELAQPHLFGDFRYVSSASIGISLFPIDADQEVPLLQQSDLAMYRAKAAGRNQLAFFQEQMQREVEHRLEIEQALTHCIEGNQLMLYLQSQFDAEGRRVGAEALLRWQHPQRGMVSPADFIPIAEDCGLIVPIGYWAMEQAFMASAQLAREGRAISLSVNISPKQFRQDDFVQRVHALLLRTGARGEDLLFEVTEGLFITDVDMVVQRIRALADLGIRFSIDDFGTGYSSLSYLQRLPLFELKIDRSFVQDIPHEPNQTAIATAILAMAAKLGLEVVAEGVETPAQGDYLFSCGCQRVQGFLLHRPEPMASWLERR